MSQDYNWSDPNATPEEDQQKPETEPSPDQTSMFAEGVEQAPSTDVEPTRMDISHDPVPEDAPLTTLYSDSAEDSTESTEVPEAPAPSVPVEDEVSNTTKAKIIAAIAIVIAAGYIAYWVQEPVLLKADVVSETSEDTPADLIVDGEVVDSEKNPDEDLNLVAEAASEADLPPGTSVNVDVSLFGFEPATLKIDKETIVVWTNTSTEDQTLIGSSDDGQSFVSPVLMSGDSFNYKFEQDATFTYYSTYNPALKATILVGLGGDSAEAIASATPEETAPLVDDPGAAAPDAPDASTMESDPAETLEAAIAARDAQITVPAEGEAAPSDPAMENASFPESETEETLHAAADPNAPDNLAETGPTEVIYSLALFGIAWLNRKKLYKAFSKS